MEPFKTLTRQELYEQVWTTPMSTLAKDFGLSDQGLAKKCKKHNIPRPPVGYWAKAAHGKAVKKVSLPSNQDPTLDTIYFYKNTVHEEFTPVHHNQLSDEQLAVALAYRIPDEVKRYHSIIRQYRKAFNKTEVDKYGRVCFRSIEKHLNFFKVTPNTFDRACLFFQGVIDLFKAIGWELGDINDYRGSSRCAFIFNEEGLTFEIKERVKQVPHTKTEQEKKRDYLWEPKYDFIPTGILEFAIENIHSSGFKTRWHDSEKAKLEIQLGSIVQGFSRGFEYAKQRTIENERRRVEYERQEAEREEARRSREIAEQRRDHLIELAKSYQQAEMIRQMIEHLKKSQQKHEGLEEWLQWATVEADALDPSNKQADILAAYENFAVEKSCLW